MRDLYGHESDAPKYEHDSYLEPLWDDRGVRHVESSELIGAKTYVLTTAKTTLWLDKLRVCFETTHGEWAVTSEKRLVKIAVFATRKHVSKHTDTSDQRRKGRKNSPQTIKRLQRGYVRGVMWIFAQRSAAARKLRKEQQALSPPDPAS